LREFLRRYYSGVTPRFELKRAAVLKWLLDSDPAIRWQAMRDLCHDDGAVVAAERARVAKEGWGAQILALQSPHGHWGGPLYGPGDRGWMTTTHTLVLLKDLGVDPDSKEARKAISRVKKHLVFRPLGDRPYFEGEKET